MKPYENILVGMNPVIRAYHRGKWLNREMPPRCAEDLYRERRRRNGAWERREDCYKRCPILGSAKKIFSTKNELFNSLLKCTLGGTGSDPQKKLLTLVPGLPADTQGTHSPSLALVTYPSGNCSYFLSKAHSLHPSLPCCDIAGIEP